jgi:hypothetical protein
MAVSKKRIIKSLENLSDDLKELLKDLYPNGYESSITRITNAKREPIFVFPLETADAIYLVKVPATKNSDGGYDVETENQPESETPGDDDTATPDEGSGFGSGGDGDDDYEEGGGKTSREASYDPDFDS